MVKIVFRERHRTGNSEMRITSTPTRVLTKMHMRVLMNIYTTMPGVLCVILHEGCHESAHESAYGKFGSAHANVHEVVVWSRFTCFVVFTCSIPRAIPRSGESNFKL